MEEATLSGRTVSIERPREILAKKIVYRGRTFQPRDVFDLACVAFAEPDEVAAILPWLTRTHLDDLDARLAEIDPILGKGLAEQVDPYPDFEPITGKCLEIVRGVLQVWREGLTPKVQVPPHPRGSHRAVFSRDGLTVVIKEWDAEKNRYDKIGNTLGPAVVGPEGSSFYLGGVKMSEDEWRDHPDVVAGGQQPRS